MPTFEGSKLLQIAMPMGGIGAGCVCLAGNGALVDFSIRNHADTTALPDGWAIKDSGFGVLHVKGTASNGRQGPVTKLLEGPLDVEKIYDQGLQSGGYRHGAYEGLPRFESAKFTNKYPFGTIELAHKKVPLKVSVTGFSPFIPLDDKNSGLPVAILEYKFENPTSAPVEFEFSYHLSHLARGSRNLENSRNQRLDDFGAYMFNTERPNLDIFGSCAVGVIGHSPKVKAMWFRGGWFDFIAALWRELSTGTFKENGGNTAQLITGMNGASVLVPGKLAPGESVTIPVVVAWHFPSSNLKIGVTGDQDGWGGDTPPKLTDPGEIAAPAWRPYYAGIWKDAGDVARYVRENYKSLRSRTQAFADALWSSTLPAESLDAIASNLAILKSPTIIRQENGQVWAWEGNFTQHGSCFGTCTHVWNYAQALPHLFPPLERTLRDQELKLSMDEKGFCQFRSALPARVPTFGGHPASDGQLGTIMRVYRDWQISGDTGWAAEMYPLVKRSIDYCIGRWDPDRRGALIEPHHNTYDIEFWGPDGMCTSIYLGALEAVAAMGESLGYGNDARDYHALAAKGAKYLDEHLYNGEYYHQRVMYKELRDQSFVESLEKPDQNPEVLALLKAEGPKYQYGNGCISDGVIGAWMAMLYGLNSPQSRDKVRSTLKAIFKHNFRDDLFEHVCTQRAGYAMGHDGGLLLCTWPHGDQPTLPFVYSDEVWTGIEYQVASHLILEGFVEEGLTIVRAARERYEGHVRNPFNEYECGSYYARAQSSYALLQSLSGFRYSAVTKTLWFGPKVKDRLFKTFFSAATGFGTIELRATDLSITMIEGTLAVGILHLDFGDSPVLISVNSIVGPAAPLTISTRLQ